MNKEDIIRMAQEAGAELAELPRGDAWLFADDKCLERFAALVASHALVEPCCGNYDQCQKLCMPRAASAEREACAKICEQQVSTHGWAQANIAASAIRARVQA